MTGVTGAAVELRVEGEAVWAVINRPHARNAIDHAVLDGLEQMVAMARAERPKVLILRGAGGSFCSGADLRELRAIANDRRGLQSFMSRLGGVLDDLERGPWATVAMVEGYAVAGGCELLLAADVVVAATDAKIGDRHAEYGLAPGAGGATRLLQTLPVAVARYLLLTGDLLSGVEAASHGLATMAVEPEALEETVGRVVDRLCSRGAGTLETIKTMLQLSPSDRAARLEQELEVFLAHVGTFPDARIGLEAFHDRVIPDFGCSGNGRPGTESTRMPQVATNRNDAELP